MAASEDFYDASLRLSEQMEKTRVALERAAPGSREQAARLEESMRLRCEWTELYAGRMEDDPEHPLAPMMHEIATELRASNRHAEQVTRRRLPHLIRQPAPRVPRAAPRARERRERRHVARATSSADPGDPDPELDPAAIRAEITAGERCKFCEIAGRLIVLARLPGVTIVRCTVCWVETDLVHRRPR